MRRPLLIAAALLGHLGALPVRSADIARCFSAGPWSLWVNPSRVTELRVDGDQLWCATTGGLFCYHLDEGTYTWWTSLHGLPESHITSIAVQEPGEVWIATREGVMRNPHGEQRLFLTVDGLQNDNVQDIAVGPDGVMWFASSEYGGGVSRYDGEGWRRLALGHTGRVGVSPANRVLAGDGQLLDPATLQACGTFEIDGRNTDLGSIRGGGKWFRWGQALCAQTPDGWDSMSLAGVPGRGDTGPTLLDREGKRIVEWRNDAWTTLIDLADPAAKTSLNLVTVSCLERHGLAAFLGGKEGLWRVTSGGVIRLTPGGYENPGAVHALHQGNEGTVWATGSQRSLMISPQAAGKPPLVELRDREANVDLVRPFLNLGAAKRCEWLEDAWQKRKIGVPDFFDAEDRILTFVCRDSEGAEWYRGRKQLAVLADSALSFVKLSPPSWILDCSASGDRLFLATREGLQVVEMPSRESRILTAGKKEVFSVHAETPDKAWFGVKWSGLSCFRVESGQSQHWDIPGHQEDKHNNMIRDIAMRGGLLYAATNGGVFELDTEADTWQRWTDDFTNAVLVDRNGNLWFGSRSALLHHDFATAAGGGRSQRMQQIETLILGLGAATWGERNTAAEKLRTLGEAVRPMLEEHRSHPDPEIRVRVRSLIDVLWESRLSLFAQDCFLLRGEPVRGRIAEFAP